MKNKTTELLDRLNKLKGLESGQIGYSYFADVKGDGRNIKSIYTITNLDGGVVYSHLNDESPTKRCDKIRAEINKIFPSKNVFFESLPKHGYITILKLGSNEMFIWNGENEDEKAVVSWSGQNAVVAQNKLNKLAQAHKFSMIK